MVQKQKLLHVMTRLANMRAAVTKDFHPLGSLDVARGLELWLGNDLVRPLFCVPLQDVEGDRTGPRLGRDFDQAHSAVRRRAQTGMPAIVGDLDPLLPCGSDDGVPRIE